jgi:hypothetical protein
MNTTFKALRSSATLRAIRLLTLNIVARLARITYWMSLNTHWKILKLRGSLPPKGQEGIHQVRQ